MCVLNILNACIVGAQLTALNVGYNNDINKEAYSYNNEAIDVSRFYKDKQTNYELGLDVFVNNDTAVHLYTNNGIHTEKYTQDNTYSLGVTKVIDDITLNLNTIVHGDEIHTPCYDSFNREYYCETLTAWSDKEIENEENNYSISLNISYKF